jgi:hypothetical protein
VLCLVKKELIRHDTKRLQATDVRAMPEATAAGSKLIDAMRKIRRHDVQLEPARCAMPVRPVDPPEA